VELLTPSLPQPVKFPGWKMHRRTCKLYIFWSCNTATFSAMHFDKNSFTCQCEKEYKRLKLLRVSNFALYCSFSSDIMAVKGLIVQFELYILYITYMSTKVVYLLCCFVVVAGATWNCCRLGAFCVHHSTITMHASVIPLPVIIMAPFK